MLDLNYNLSKRKRLIFANIVLDDFSFDEILILIDETIKNKTKNLFIITLDILGAYNSIFDNYHKKLIMNADIVTCDGAGLKLLTFLKGKNHIKNKVSGVDLTEVILQHASKKNLKVAFIGSKSNVIDILSNTIPKKYPGCLDFFFHHGYFNEDYHETLIKKIMEFQPDVLFVALGMPKQEKFISTISTYLKGVVMMGVGGTFDVLANVLKRAPKFMQKFYLEWLFRLYQEPKRFVRMLNIPKYIVYALFCELFKKN